MTNPHKLSAFSAASFVLLGVCGCVVEPTVAPPLDTFALHATVTPDNKCTVEALGRTYTSIGQVRGAVLPTFSGSLENEGYHAIGCWVANADGTDGDLIVTFSGNSFQQPFPTGTFEPMFEAPFGSTLKLVSVSFRASFFPNEKLRTNDGSEGSVVVESALSGARTIHVDVMAIKYQM
jgi:hypothetical protein